MFEKTWNQAEIAFSCLQKASTHPEDTLSERTSANRLAYLLHAAVLFFIVRDQQAFARVWSHPDYARLQKPLRQLPTYNQLSAVLKSQGADTERLLEAIVPLSDAALGVERLHAFRDAFLINGLPDDGLPFETPTADVDALIAEALAGWVRLQSSNGRPRVSSPR